MQVALFPLRTVLYPGGPLPLRIFEPRYLDMISKCLKNDSPFGVLLIRSGSETGAASTYDIGTLARITDWNQGSDGLLEITAVGEQRFRLLSSSRQADGLNIGTIELLAEEAGPTLPDEYKPLAQILSGVLDDLGRLYETLDRNYDDDQTRSASGWDTSGRWTSGRCSSRRVRSSPANLERSTSTGFQVAAGATFSRISSR